MLTHYKYILYRFAKELIICFLVTCLVVLYLVYSNEYNKNLISGQNLSLVHIFHHLILNDVYYSFLKVIMWDINLIFVVLIFLPYIASSFGLIVTSEVIYKDVNFEINASLPNNDSNLRNSKRFDNVNKLFINKLSERFDLFCALFVMFFIWRVVYDRGIKLIDGSYIINFVNVKSHFLASILMFLNREYFARKFTNYYSKLTLKKFDFESIFANVLAWNIRKDWVLNGFMLLQNFLVTKNISRIENIETLINIIMLIIVTSVAIRLTNKILYRLVNL